MTITELINNTTSTRESQFSEPNTLLAALPTLPPAVPTLLQVSSDERPLVYLMCDPRSYHLSLWRSSEEWCVLVNPEPLAEYCDVGWDIYAGWSTNFDFAAAREAIRAFVLNGVVVPYLEWRWDSA